LIAQLDPEEAVRPLDNTKTEATDAETLDKVNKEKGKSAMEAARNGWSQGYCSIHTFDLMIDK